MGEFVVESIDIDGASELASTIEEAALEGSIIANIQKEASNNGVLTQALADMPRVLENVTTEVKASTKEIQEQVTAPAPPTPAPETPAPPTPAPVDDPAGDFSAGTSVAPAFGTVMAIFALSM